MPDKKQPFCWKCASKIETLTKDDSFVLDGCITESKIKCYDDAKTMCPLIFPQENKVIIIIVNGAAQIEYKPDDIEIEIRDYDIEGGDPPEERPDCKKDNVGDWYQEMIFPIEEIDLGSEQVIVSPAKKIKFSANGPSCFTDVELKFHNYYRCPDCQNTWEDEWDCMCDDECGECGCSDISPYKSVDIPQSIGWQPSPADYPLAGLQTFEVYEDLEMGKGCHPEVKNWIEIFEGMIEKPTLIPSDKE